MQKNIRLNENHLLHMATKAKQEKSMSGMLYKKSSDTAKGTARWFVLHKNMLFYFDTEASVRPSGVAILEGCYCERVITPPKLREIGENQFCFTITYKNDAVRQYDLRAETECECKTWIEAIQKSSYSKVVEQKEEIEQKYLHLLQILDSERQAKWQYVQSTEELNSEVQKLKAELQKYKLERRTSNHKLLDEESDEIKKIKKVQSFFRGWLCRRRWKQIVEMYIRSPHAESMRIRNSLVFSLVEAEEEYNTQLSVLVTCFLRPLRMAASSKKPPITHDDVNSIFLNSETLLFLHQIFLKGLTARLENWPTLVLGDLFDMLLPMLCIYQEYVRNHHYSLQVLAEYKQKCEFNNLLKRYEEKQGCEGRSIEAFLTYPMHQIPRYIVTLHDLLAHTPHEHVERLSLEYAQTKLEELSRMMHDEVSETENIRKNLSIERMIVEGCDILLDVSQTFVRQGPLLQVVLPDKPKSARARLGSFGTTFKDTKKEVVRQVFLFTNHMLLTTRASNGKLHLVKGYGKIPLADCTLIEDSASDFLADDPDNPLDSSNLSAGSQAVLLSVQIAERDNKSDYNGLDFRIIVDVKSGPPVTVILVASTLQEKGAWGSDISQCIENLHYSELVNSSMSESSSVTMPQSVRSDPKLFRDDIDIKFSRTLNSCKVPQIRHASVNRLMDRLTDLRFLSIDFLNTFLLTYRVFTTGNTVLQALRRVYKNPEYGNLESSSTSLSSSQLINETDAGSPPQGGELSNHLHPSRCLNQPVIDRRISTGCMKEEMMGEGHGESKKPPTPLTPKKRVAFSPVERAESTDSEEGRNEIQSILIPPKGKLAPIASCETLNDMGTDSIIDTITSTSTNTSNSEDIKVCLTDHNPTESSTDDPVTDGDTSLEIPESIDEESEHDSTSTVSRSGTGSGTGSGSGSHTLTPSTPTMTPLSSPYSGKKTLTIGPTGLTRHSVGAIQHSNVAPVHTNTNVNINLESLALSPAHSSSRTNNIRKQMVSSSPIRIPSPIRSLIRTSIPNKTVRTASPGRSPVASPKLRRAPSPIAYSYSSPSIIPTTKVRPWSGKRGSIEAESIGFTPRTSFAYSQRSSIAPSTVSCGSSVWPYTRSSSMASSTRSSIAPSSRGSIAPSSRGSIVPTAEDSPSMVRAGAVVTSSRASKRRSSSTAATAAFACATAGGSYPCEGGKPGTRYQSQSTKDASRAPQVNLKQRDSAICTAAAMRVLNVLKHWITKHSQDFECDAALLHGVRDFLEEIVMTTNLTPTEHKTAANLLKQINVIDPVTKQVILTKLLHQPVHTSKDTFDSLSALDIAEQLTFLDHQIFINIRSEELLNQAWMKNDKGERAPHVLLVSKRFNEVSRLVASEIVGRLVQAERVCAIEKWAAIADICRCMHNYNGVLQICSAFVNSSVYRLKKTWDKISKQSKQMIDRMQALVSSDGRFKNMREALHRCDPPCIPYLGMYLTDLSFIEESTPNSTDDGLINFSKMRMIAHVIREIRLYQQTQYRIQHHPRKTLKE